MVSHEQTCAQRADLTAEEHEKLPARENAFFLKTTEVMLTIPRDVSDGYESDL